MHKPEILQAVTAIIATLLTAGRDIQNLLQAMIQMRALLTKINASENSAANGAYLYHLLVDSDALTSNQDIIKNLTLFAALVLQENPSIVQHLTTMRSLPRSLFNFIISTKSPTLKELVAKAKIMVYESWVDPITSRVMDYPVKYTINGSEYTLDLFTLLNNSDKSFGLRCPFTRQYVFLSDLQPCIDLTNKIRLATGHVALAPKKDPQQEIDAAAVFIRQGNFIGLKNWYENNSEIDLDLPVRDPEQQQWCLMHFACKLGFFDIALWLMNKGASHLHPNAKGEPPYAIISIEKLEAASKQAPENCGLNFLLAMYYQPFVDSARSSLHTLNLQKAIQGKYPAALSFRGVLLCTSDNMDEVISGAIMLREAIKKGYAVSAVLIYKVYTEILPSKPLLQIFGQLTNLGIRDVINDCISVLSNDYFFHSRSHLENACATLMLENIKLRQNEFDRVPQGHDHIKALCFATLAATNTNHDDIAQVLLRDICDSLGMTEVYKHYSYESYIRRKGQQLGVLKPWVQYHPTYSF